MGSELTLLGPTATQDDDKYLLLALFLGVAMAAEYEDAALMGNSEARFLYLNSSSTATSLTLLGALILLGVIFYLVYVGGLLSPAASSYSSFGQDYKDASERSLGQKQCEEFFQCPYSLKDAVK